MTWSLGICTSLSQIAFHHRRVLKAEGGLLLSLDPTQHRFNTCLDPHVVQPHLKFAVECHEDCCTCLQLSSLVCHSSLCVRSSCLLSIVEQRLCPPLQQQRTASLGSHPPHGSSSQVSFTIFVPHLLLSSLSGCSFPACSCSLSPVFCHLEQFLMFHIISRLLFLRFSVRPLPLSVLQVSFSIQSSKVCVSVVSVNFDLVSSVFLFSASSCCCSLCSVPLFTF